MNISTRSVNRRHFLKAGALTFGALGMGSMAPFLQKSLAGDLPPGKKLLFIFLRGAMDAVQAVIPYGDQGRGSAKSYTQARPNIGIDQDDAHSLNNFCSLNPALQGDGETDPKVHDIFNGDIDARGANLAFLHRIGYQNQNRSHFSSQQFWENGIPGNVKLEEGIFNRYITSYLDEERPLQAATLSGNQMVLMKGETLIPVIGDINSLQMADNVQLGTFPTADNPLGTGLKGAYGQAGYNQGIKYNKKTYDTGVALLNNLQFFQDNVLNRPYFPAANARPYFDAIGNNGFRNNIRDSARLMKQVDDIQIVGCNQGGYDTHGGEDTRFPALMRDLGLALTGLYHDLADIWDDVLVVTMSEFGRTSQENGNRGTDHGEASLCFAMGGAVNGGVYNCSRASWANGDLFSTSNSRYVAHKTDYRNVYNEILSRHLGDPDEQMDSIIPNYDNLVSRDRNGYFDPLNFINA